MKNYLPAAMLTFLMILAAVLPGSAQEAAEPPQPGTSAVFDVPVTLAYSSIYWWRGTVLDDGAGVFWPGTGILFGDAGLELSVAAGISEHWFTKEDTASEDLAKSYTEIDYGLSWSKDIGMISLGLGVMYCHWPFYDEIDPDAADPSFLETGISAAIDTILSPTIEFYYDYYVEAYEGSDGEDVPTAEDYYAKLSVSHDILSTTDGFAVTAGAWLGYYNDPYFEASGWSDAVISLGFSKEHEKISAGSSLYYGRSLGKDFRDANDGVKNHFWCDFGLTYTL